jgi:hypothetical protein
MLLTRGAISAKMVAMKLAKPFLCALLALAIATDASAQDAQQDDNDANSNLPIQSDTTATRFSAYMAGDNIFAISLGALFPLFFTDKHYNSLKDNVQIGGAGSLAYLYFLTPRVFVGGELEGSFDQTLGQNYLFIVPITARIGYQWIVNRFEFPVSVSVGGAAHSYQTKTLFSVFAKAQASAFFRFSEDWSFGLNAAFWWAPEITREPEKDAFGHFFELSASARYHF